MTERERRDYYLKRIEKVLMSRFVLLPRIGIKRIEEELKIIKWNNSEEWTEAFMIEEVVPLLKRHGINVEMKKRG